MSIDVRSYTGRASVPSGTSDEFGPTIHLVALQAASESAGIRRKEKLFDAVGVSSAVYGVAHDVVCPAIHAGGT